MTRLPRPFAVLAFALLGGGAALFAGCSGQNPYQASDSANSVSSQVSLEVGDAPAPATEINVFTPENANVSSCVGTMERPDCGSKSKGGWRMYLTFAVLMSGMGYIGWRIARSIRQRDAVMNAGTEDGPPRSPSLPGPA